MMRAVDDGDNGRITGRGRRARAVLALAAALAVATGAVAPARAATTTTTMKAPYASAGNGGYCQVGTLPAQCRVAGGADAATGVIAAEARVEAAALGAGTRTYEAGITATHTVATTVKAIDYEVQLMVDSAEARDLTTARTGSAVANVGVHVLHPHCVAQCGYYGYASSGPAFLATDLDGVGVYQLLMRPWYKPVGVTSTTAKPITIRFRYQRHDGASLPPATVQVKVPVELIAVVGSWTSTFVGGASGWIPDQGSAFARAKVTVVSIAATPVA